MGIVSKIPTFRTSNQIVVFSTSSEAIEITKLPGKDLFIYFKS